MVNASDRVKTDRRDAVRLARSLRAGDLTPVLVPDADQQALRELVRTREDARQDQHRARHPLSQFLLRDGQRLPEEVKKGSPRKYMTWIKEQAHIERPAWEATLLYYVAEVEHMAARIERLHKAIAVAVEKVAPRFAWASSSLASPDRHARQAEGRWVGGTPTLQFSLAVFC